MLVLVDDGVKLLVVLRSILAAHDGLDVSLVAGLIVVENAAGMSVPHAVMHVFRAILATLDDLHVLIVTQSALRAVI